MYYDDRLPPPSRRHLRIVKNLENLPAELVEPILEDLPLYRVIELMGLCQGSYLRQLLRSSPSWGWLFNTKSYQLQSVWESLNMLSWLWCRSPCYGVEALSHPALLASSAEAKNLYGGGNRRDTHNVAAGRLEDELRAHFVLNFRRLLGCDLQQVESGSRQIRLVYAGFSAAQLQAICLFLPSQTLSRLAKDRYKDPYHGRRGQTDERPWDYRDYLQERESISGGAFCRTQDLINHHWSAGQARLFLEDLATAYKMFREACEAELVAMSELYERHPTKLKLPFAPQEATTRTKHVVEALLRDAKRVRNRAVRRGPENVRLRYYRKASIQKEFFRFRYPHTAVVPYDWCLTLFEAVVGRYPLPDHAERYPAELIPALEEAQAGLKEIYHRNRGQFGKLLRRIDDAGRFDTEQLKEPIKLAGHSSFFASLTGPPRPLRELSWLKSFIACVEWMEKAFIGLAAECQSISHGDGSATGADNPSPVGVTDGVIFNPTDYQKFVAEAPAGLVASRLRLDSKFCNKRDTPTEQGPSPLALHLPSFSSARGREIAKHLVLSADMGLEIQELVYDSLRQKVSRALARLPAVKGHGDGYKLACEFADEAQNGFDGSVADAVPDHIETDETPGATAEEITQADLATAARVLTHLLQTSVSREPSALDALQLIAKAMGSSAPTETQPPPRKSSTSWKDTVKGYLAALPPGSLPGSTSTRFCYICRLNIHTPHKSFPAMCVPCGEFNLAGSELSAPGRLDLSGKTAIVTGARVNLGYHVALRLLRSGARVIASTRYPLDAVTRYQAEPDSDDWMDRLRVVGADFRSARDAFELVRQTRAILESWGGRLDILINNAAQTLTDSVKKEEQAVKRELLLEGNVSPVPLLQQHGYAPRVRGGAIAMIEGPTAEFSKELSLVDRTVGKSSWMQSMSEIPYEDVISAHSVNTFVPLILMRELMPFMGRSVDTPAPSSPKQGNPNRTAGYVVNVSSREGIFESKTAHDSKSGKHVHTNMSKAALNMITETEASTAWRERRVAVNTVDPGYMSAAPECEQSFGGERPIGWEDGAGRVLWPVAIGEQGDGTLKGGLPVWGRFLKHYGAVRVEPGWGRG